MSMPLDELEFDATKAEQGEADSSVAVIEGRSLWSLAWRRLRRDKIAMISLAVILLIVLAAIFAPVLTAIEGQDPNTFHPDLLTTGGGGNSNPLFNLNVGVPGLPKSQFRTFGSEHWLGVEAGSGRDIFARIVYGARISLIIALLATLVSVVLGTALGALAGYVGGPVDYVISRIMDFLLAFPQLLLAITITPILQERFNGSFLDHGSILQITALVIILGFFGWPYLARIVRGQVLSLREREFVEAARAIGARPRRIVFREIVPNVVAVVLVYSTLAIPTNITAEAALSFLGVGVKDPTPSWGGMLNLSQSNNFYQQYPFWMAVPGIALLLTVLSFNLIGDAVRDALDPKASRG